MKEFDETKSESELEKFRKWVEETNQSLVAAELIALRRTCVDLKKRIRVLSEAEYEGSIEFVQLRERVDALEVGEVFEGEA